MPSPQFHHTEIAPSIFGTQVFVDRYILDHGMILSDPNRSRKTRRGGRPVCQGRYEHPGCIVRFQSRAHKGLQARTFCLLIIQKQEERYECC